MLTLIFPHSIAANLAFPDQVLHQGEGPHTSPFLTVNCCPLHCVAQCAIDRYLPTSPAVRGLDNLLCGKVRDCLRDAVQTMYMLFCRTHASKRRQSG